MRTFDTDVSRMFNDNIWFHRIFYSVAAVLMIIIIIVHTKKFCNTQSQSIGNEDTTHRRKVMKNKHHTIIAQKRRLQPRTQSPSLSQVSPVPEASPEPSPVAQETENGEHNTYQSSNTYTNKSGVFRVHSHKPIKKARSNYDSDNDRNIFLIGSKIATFLCLYFNLCFLLLLTLMFWQIGLNKKNLNDNFSCGILISGDTLSYHLAKVCMYFIIISRIEISFKNSIYARNKYVIKGLLVFLLIFMIACIIGDFTDIYGEWEYNNELDVYYCNGYFALWGLWTTAVIDVCLSIICLYLFVKPLRSLINNAREQGNEGQLVNLTKRVTVLSTIAMMTTNVALVFIIFSGFSSVVAVDSVVNSLCVILMNKMHHKLYYRLCWICHQCVARLT